MTRSASASRRRAVGLAAALTLAAVATAAWMRFGHRSAPTPAPGASGVAWTELERRRIGSLSPLGPPPADPTNRFADDPAAAALGQALFFDEGFARGPALSCATCHDPEQWFTDGADVPMGAELGVRNTPTVLDSAHQRWLFWDGRADSLWSQALEPFEDVREYDSTRLRVVRRLATEPDLRAAYEAAIGPLPPPSWFDDRPVDATPRRAPDHPHRIAWEAMSEADRRTVDLAFVGLGKAIAAYERRLASGPSPFDRFAGDLAAGGDGAGHLSPAAARGLRLFIGRADCRTCHFGPRLSDGVFHATGVPSRRSGLDRDRGRAVGLTTVQADPFNAAGPYSDAPEGAQAGIVRASIGGPDDHAAFRTPTLRNVAETAPYMHAGQLQTLEEVVRFYSTLEGAERFDHHGQAVLQRLDLTEQEIADLVAFLESLTGPLPPAELRRPPAD